jgi:hypothetical protein
MLLDDTRTMCCSSMYLCHSITWILRPAGIPADLQLWLPHKALTFSQHQQAPTPPHPEGLFKQATGWPLAHVLLHHVPYDTTAVSALTLLNNGTVGLNMLLDDPSLTSPYLT